MAIFCNIANSVNFFILFLFHFFFKSYINFPFFSCFRRLGNDEECVLENNLIFKLGPKLIFKVELIEDEYPETGSCVQCKSEIEGIVMPCEHRIFCNSCFDKLKSTNVCPKASCGKKLESYELLI